MSTKQALVTGGAGFIGSHVAQALLRAGYAVRTIDNFSTGNRGNLASIHGDIELIEGDIRSYERTHRATRGVDVVIHLAALPSVPRSVQDPLTTNDVNVTGTLNVVLAARDAGVKRVVFASSSSRPFELASLGACMVCNPYEGIETWFEPEKELIVVHSAEEAIERYTWLLAHDDARRAMGQAARERFLKEHTFRHRARQLVGIIQGYLS